MKTIPFWSDQFPRPTDLPVSEIPERTDVAVVGSGYTGLNAAISLAKAGVEVVILEAKTIAWGASSRHGSFVSPSLKASWTTIQKKYGSDKTRQFWNWAVDSVTYVTNIIQAEGLECDYRRTGMLGLAVKSSHAESLREHGEYLDKMFGYQETRYIPGKELPTEIGSSLFYGGLTFDLGYQIHPAKYAFGLARVAAKYGAKTVENSPVIKLSKINNGYLLRTSQGELKADKVLLATNGYTTNLAPQARNGILPIGSYMIVTEPLTQEIQSQICPTGRLFWDSKIFLNYFGLTPDGRAFIGGRSNLSPNLDLERTGIELLARLLEIFPQLEKVDVTHSWSGRLGVSFDQMPHIGRQDGIYYAYGYSGQGVPNACYLGKEVGELIAGKRQDSLFLEIKHPKTFLANLDPLFLPFVSAWFKFLDRIQ